MNATLCQDLKLALLALIRPGAVVSAQHHGRCFAMTVTSFAEVSTERSSMLVCVSRAGSVFAPIEAGCRFALNLLSSEQAPISQACGGGCRMDDRISDDNWQVDADEPPLLRGACASILMSPAGYFNHDTHRIVIGNVERVRREPSSMLALHDGAYLRRPPNFRFHTEAERKHR
jgi:flavin reductase (DIM6/NTAB) family NADH-FMN oxidoreductase RutF